MEPAAIIAARYKRVVVLPSPPYRPPNLNWIADHQMEDLSNTAADAQPEGRLASLASPNPLN